MKCFVFVLLLAVIGMAFGSSENARDRICYQPLVTGRCLALFYYYGYVPGKNECVRFIYGGCGGNSNSFPTKKACEDICMPKDLIPTPEEKIFKLKVPTEAHNS